MSPVDKLLELCDDRINEVRVAAAYALGEAAFENPKVSIKLMEMTGDRFREVQVAAIKALGRHFRPSDK